MAQIEYCPDEDVARSWHPAFDLEVCSDDDWLERVYGNSVWSKKQWAILAAAGLDSEVDEQEFLLLAKRWKRETAFDGSLSKIVMHADYQRIMAMGPDVIPLIIRDLADKPAHWFWALHNLVPNGQDPAE